MSFSDFYKNKKYDKIFEKTFDKFYKRGHFGDIERDVIRKQQKEWFLTFKQIIEEKDFGSILDVVKDRDHNQVTREFFTRLTKINIKKKKIKYIKEKLKEFCFNTIINKNKKTFKDMLNEDS